MPGDSQIAILDETYKRAFVDTLRYQEEQIFDQQDHFPLFLMGNALTTLVRARQRTRNHLTDISSLKHSVFELQMIEQPANTFLFNSMTVEEY
jgi:hypothetical protein